MLVRYNPWDEMNAITRQLDSLFQDLQAPTFRTPAAELHETDSALQNTHTVNKKRRYCCLFCGEIRTILWCDAE